MVKHIDEDVVIEFLRNFISENDRVPLRKDFVDHFNISGNQIAQQSGIKELLEILWVMKEREREILKSVIRKRSMQLDEAFSLEFYIVQSQVEASLEALPDSGPGCA